MLIAISFIENDVKSNDYGKKMISHLYDTETNSLFDVSPETFQDFLRKNKGFQYNTLMDEWVSI